MNKKSWVLWSVSSKTFLTSLGCFSVKTNYSSGKRREQAGAELGQAQVRLDDIVEVVINLVVKAVVKVEV